MRRVYTAPDTHPPDPPRHRCGRCANPFTYGREDCPNNTKQEEVKGT